MHLVSKRVPHARVSRDVCNPNLLATAGGFSIVEGLVAAVILVVSLLGTASAFNLIMASISGTSDKNSVSLAIDKDISLIKQIASKYTSCVVPTGSLPAEDEENENAACDVSSNFSAYYFPKDPSAAEQDKFFAACRSNTSGSHITAGFMDEINDLSALGSGVTRKSAVRENGSDHKNHNIIIEYQYKGSTVRLLKVAPVVSSWCG